MWPVTIAPAAGVRVSIGTASKIAITEGAAITALQKAEHAAGATPFSSPAQPSHLPDMDASPGMDMSASMGISVAAAIADLTTMSEPAKPCVTRPAAKTKADSKADIRRVCTDSMTPR